jgi:hypothetical protein
MKYVSLVAGLFVLVVGCSRPHINTPQVSGNNTLSKDEFGKLTQGLRQLQVGLRQLAAEDLLKGLVESPAQGTLERESPYEAYFRVCKKYFVEVELANRGLAVKECLPRHQHDSVVIFTGFSFPCPLLSDVCTNELARIRRLEAGETDDKTWHLCLSFVERDSQVGGLIRASANR